MTIQISKKKGFDLRKINLAKSKRVVVKVGSAVLTGENGLDQQIMMNLADEISFLVRSKKEVILVSSGEFSLPDMMATLSGFAPKQLSTQFNMASGSQAGFVFPWERSRICSGSLENRYPVSLMTVSQNSFRLSRDCSK